MSTILIVTRTDDNECIDRVSDAIKKRGSSVIRLDTDRFPTDLRLSAEYGSFSGRFVLESGGDSHNIDSISAVWYRRHRVGAGIPESMEPQLRRAAVDESRASLLGMIASLPVFQMDSYSSVRRASIKPLQLQTAQMVGLQIPRTLISNDPGEVRAFSQACPQGIVAKMLTSFHIYEDGLEKVVFTNPITDKSLQNLDGLQFSPMTFQERIPKKLELRVTVVGNRFFVAAVDSGKLIEAQADWRRKGRELMESWQHHELPSDVQTRLLAFMDHFHLNYAAMDLIITPDDRCVFLEANPVGEYFWLELSPGLPISQEIAEVLLDLAPRR